MFWNSGVPTVPAKKPRLSTFRPCILLHHDIHQGEPLFALSEAVYWEA